MVRLILDPLSIPLSLPFQLFNERFQSTLSEEGILSVVSNSEEFEQLKVTAKCSVWGGVIVWMNDCVHSSSGER